MVNTLYGSLVCRHFAIGNTVVANNITARACLGVWMLAKALGLRQTITDGGIYQPAAVPHLKPDAKCPGLDTLSRPEAWARPKLGRTIGPLGGACGTPERYRPTPMSWRWRTSDSSGLPTGWRLPSLSWSTNTAASSGAPPTSTRLTMPCSLRRAGSRSTKFEECNESSGRTATAIGAATPRSPSLTPF